MKRPVLTTSILLSASAIATALVAGPATASEPTGIDPAAATRAFDAAGDVVGRGVSPSPRAAARATDLRRVETDSDTRTVVLSFTFSGGYTPRGSETATLTMTSLAGGPALRWSAGSGVLTLGKAVCPGSRATRSPATGALRLVVPSTCLAGQRSDEMTAVALTARPSAWSLRDTMHFTLPTHV